ncbi:MAG TPA: MFS transporter [Bacteroidia bacterium]|jgi:MFS family permease
MRNTVRQYSKLNRSILNLITVEFFVQLINVLFVAILPLYMKAEGYSDAQYAHFTSYRYFGMLALALFLGMYIKGRRILPMIKIAAIGVPLFAVLIIIGVQIHSNALLLIAHLLWGTAYTFIQIPILPYIMRNAPKEQQTLSITLNFATWSIATIMGSFIVAVLNGINPVIFNEHNLLLSMSIICFSGIYFAFKMKRDEHVPVITEKRSNLKKYDWTVITKALVPTAIIALGAGFTIPFMSLFFSNVHNMSTSVFSSLNTITAILVTIVAIYIPQMKDRFGYRKVVPTTQSFAIVALIIMATTQYYSDLSISVIIAAVFYLFRQPLMSAAVPMTSEITMKYVGEGNREMVSALTSAIWSGTAYFSAIGFGILRHMDVAYVNIFWITSGMYSIGVILYTMLIRDYNKREKAGLISL